MLRVAADRFGNVWYAETGTRDVVVLDPVTEERRRARIETRGAVVRNLIVDESAAACGCP